MSGYNFKHIESKGYDMNLGTKLNKKMLYLSISLVMLLQAQIIPAQENVVPPTFLPADDFNNKMQTLVSVDFKETPIDDVIKSLAEQVDIDVIKSPKVTGTVTATLKDVPLGEALDNILATQGYGRVMTDNVVRIVPAAEVQIQIEKQESKVFRIVYADVKEVEKALKGVVSGTGRIASNAGTSNIMVIDNESHMKAIKEFINEIDRETPQVLVEARIYDISSSDSLDLGIQWSVGTNTTLTPATSPTTGSPTGTGQLDPFITGVLASTINKTPKSTGTLRFGILTDNIDLDAVLSAIEEKICAKLLANPRIMVLDNDMANIKIVSEIPYQELTQTTGGGNIGTTQFKEVGVELEVTPHVTRDGMIKLKVRPKFSIQTSTVTISIPTAQDIITSPQPVIDKREAITTALIKDGQTVVIGGLKRKDVTQETSKVPLLGDIPLLGWAFTYHGENTTNSELVVFITPRIITDPVLSEGESETLRTSDEEICKPVCPNACMDRCVNPPKDKYTTEE